MLALLTGLVAGQLTLPSRDNFGSPAYAPSAKAELLAAGYYDAVNRYLSGEGPSRLETLIHPDYIGHPAESEAGESRVALLARLDGLKRSFPHIQLRTEVISADSQLVVVRVAVAGTSGGDLAGMPIEVLEAPSEIEVLRFDGDELVERWSHLQWPAILEVQGTALHTTSVASPLQPRLERIILESDETMELADGTAYLIATETGELEIEGQERPSISATELLTNFAVPIVADVPITLRGGELALAAHNGPYTIHSSGSGPDTFLLFQIENFVRESQLSSMPFQGPPASGTATERITLATSLEIESDERPWVISIGRVTLATGTVLASHEVDGVEIVVVESGELRTQVDDCTDRCFVTREGSSTFVSGETLLQEADGFSAAQGATIAYDSGASGSATFLLITIARPQVEQTYS